MGNIRLTLWLLGKSFEFSRRSWPSEHPKCLVKVIGLLISQPTLLIAIFAGFDPSKVVSYLCNTGVLSYPGGLPSSLIASGQQWDFPNAWAPTTWVIIQGLRASGQQALARQIAEKWIRKNYDTWISSGGRMFEKVSYPSCFSCCELQV